jgi:hypothetical protein
MSGPQDLWTWGSRPEERAEPFPCDDVIANADVVAWRAVDVAAPAPVLFRWLCQLRVAPYSYDWIDNFGRRSPRRLIPSLNELAVGQRVMSIFEIVSFTPDVHMTVRTRPGRLGSRCAVTYRVVPLGPERSRLLVKLVVKAPRLLGQVLVVGDFIMMRKQLLTLRHLAETTARTTVQRTRREPIHAS